MSDTLPFALEQATEDMERTHEINYAFAQEVSDCEDARNRYAREANAKAHVRREAWEHPGPGSTP